LHWHDTMTSSGMFRAPRPPGSRTTCTAAHQAGFRQSNPSAIRYTNLLHPSLEGISSVSDEVEKKSREAAMNLYGHGKGSLSIASENAFSDWVSTARGVTNLVDLVGDPVDAIYGCLSGEKTSGVDLQHEAQKMRTRKAPAYRGAP